jgi:biopolymer transport protein ExbD
MAASSLSLSDNRTAMAEINITPLIDVMLALMLIFMLTAPVLTSRIPMPLASSNQHEDDQRKLELDVDAQGQVSRGGYALSPLEVKVELATFGSKEGAKSLQIRPDANTSHQNVVALIDQANLYKISNISLEMPAH